MTNTNYPPGITNEDIDAQFGDEPVGRIWKKSDTGIHTKEYMKEFKTKKLSPVIGRDEVANFHNFVDGDN